MLLRRRLAASPQLLLRRCLAASPLPPHSSIARPVAPPTSSSVARRLPYYNNRNHQEGEIGYNLMGEVRVVLT